MNEQMLGTILKGDSKDLRHGNSKKPAKKHCA